MLCSNCASSISRDLLSLVVEPKVVLNNVSYSEKVADLENEILEIESMMENLANRRTMLRRNINRLSPPSLLPAEILTEIFKLACQPSPSHSCPSTSAAAAVTNNNDDGHKPLTPLFFGSICKEWRDIAWSTPLLWNSLSLHVSRKTNSHSHVHLLQDWLLRAQSSPLHIKLTMDDEHEPPNFSSLRSIIQVLATRSAYWHSLDSLLPAQCNDILRDNHFPALTSVAIRPPKGSIATFSEPPNMFRSAPKLLDVDLTGYNFSGMVLPWNQLRRFKAQFLTVSECLKILDTSPNLKECHLESVYSHSPDVGPVLLIPPTSSSTSASSSTLIRSNLQVLDVVLIKSGAISLLENVTLPSLRDLRVQYSGSGSGPGTSESLLRAITALVIRSSCNLQNLHIEKRHFHEDDLIPCLEALSSSLTNLRLITLGAGGEGVVDPLSAMGVGVGGGGGSAPGNSTGLTARLTTMLHPSYHSGNPLLPNLKTLEYRGPIRCDEDSLISMLSDRWRVHHPGQHGVHCVGATATEVKQEPEQRQQQSSTIQRIAQLSGVTLVSSDVARLSSNFVGEVARLAKEGMVLDIRSS